jgi:branched-subunit amino acid ABC-type transport system permease component
LADGIGRIPVASHEEIDGILAIRVQERPWVVADVGIRIPQIRRVVDRVGDEESARGGVVEALAIVVDAEVGQIFVAGVEAVVAVGGLRDGRAIAVVERGFAERVVAITLDDIAARDFSFIPPYSFAHPMRNDLYC